MKKAILTLVLGLALLGRPAPARAENVMRCMLQAISDCDASFPNTEYHLVAIRGWCYMIATGICAAS